MKNIYISPSVMIEKIAPGEGIRYTATVYGGEKLKNGEVVLRVTVAAGDYSECDWQEFSLPTQKRGYCFGIEIAIMRNIGTSFSTF